MNRLFTLLLVAVVAIAARATDYNVPVTVTVNGVSSEQTGAITIDENNGLYDITLKNFMLQSEDGPMGVGNVELRGVSPFQDGNATLLVTTGNVTITPGDDPSISFWMASILPPVNIELRGKIEGDRLRCYIDIDLTETLGQTIQVAIGDGYQIANQGFEAWHTTTDSYVEPNGWHSFESATGGLAILAGHHIERSLDAHSGEASARIFATSIFGIVANGTMTTGRMNAGAMSAEDPANHAYLDMSMTDVDGNGDPFYTPMYVIPDSVAVWVKFKQGKPDSDHPYATISAVITDGTRYQDPEDKEYTNVVAKAKNDRIAATNDEWVRVTAPFVATGNAVEPKAVLVTMSTNADAGQGSGTDELLIDDIEFIYNAKVTGLKIKGVEVPWFDPEVTSYEMELDGEITADDIDVAIEGNTVYVTKEIEQEADHYLCRVNAINADMTIMSSYLVKVDYGVTGISSQRSAATHQATYFMLDGRRVAAPASGSIYVSHQADGTTVKIRR